MSRTPTLFSISYIKSRTSFGLARTGLRHGAFNAGLNMVFSDGATWMVRFPRARMVSEVTNTPTRSGHGVDRPEAHRQQDHDSCPESPCVTGAGGLQRRLSIFNTSSGRTGNSATELEFLVFINVQNKYVEGKVLETYNG
ncbi:hypothetical protein GX48_05285 [Paracoccidioides brasiliensis]|nr:hypothetical protein GX48_05285 [Paracoccidioides brasiliensis]